MGSHRTVCHSSDHLTEGFHTHITGSVQTFHIRLHVAVGQNIALFIQLCHTLYQRSCGRIACEHEHTDVAALASPLFHIFGRLGCFLSGCCFGVESSVGFVYHHCLIEEANGVSRFPVQLVEAFANLFIFLLLFIL